MSKILDHIRQGESAILSIPPRAQWRKLWDYCRRQSEDGTVNVRVLWSGTYGLKQIQRRQRIGRAVPQLTVRPRWDILGERNVVHYTDISWSFVY